MKIYPFFVCLLKWKQMLKDVVNIIRETALKHKAVRTFKYQADILNNAQNNHEYYQVYLDDVSYHQLNITTNIFRVEFNLYILGFVDDENPILDVQNNAYTIAADIIAKIDTDEANKGSLSVYDYSIVTLSHYTDDDAAGVKLSLVLAMPSPVDLCILDDNFNDEPYEPKEDDDITINKEDVGDITIKPIRLPKNRVC